MQTNVLMIFPEYWPVMDFDVFPNGKYISSLWATDWTLNEKMLTWNQWKALRRSCLHVLGNKNSKGVDSSVSQESELVGCKDPWEGRRSWFPLQGPSSFYHPMELGLGRWLQDAAATLMLFCAFSHFLMQQISITTYHLPTLQGSMDTAKKKQSSHCCKILVPRGGRQTINAYINKYIELSGVRRKQVLCGGKMVWSMLLSSVSWIGRFHRWWWCDIWTGTLL